MRPHEKLSSQVRCVECRREAPVGEHGWRAYLTEDEGEPAEAVLNCPDCAPGVRSRGLTGMEREATGRVARRVSQAFRRDTIEHSAMGSGAAHTAGVRVIAIPNRRYRPPADALELADVVLGSVPELAPETVAAV